VTTDQWGTAGAQVANAMPHIELSREADAPLIAPVHGQFHRQLAHGWPDDPVSSTAGARPPDLAPLPAAGGAGDERRDVAQPGTQRNVAALRAAASRCRAGQRQPGLRRIRRRPHARAARTARDLIAFFQPKVLADSGVLITAGPTFERSTRVRGITNCPRQDGFARAAPRAEAGAKVTLVAGPAAWPRRAACAASTC